VLVAGEELASPVVAAKEEKWSGGGDPQRSGVARAICRAYGFE